jgi:hypothetical protein
VPHQLRLARIPSANLAEKPSPEHSANSSDDLSSRTALSYFRILEQARLGEPDQERASTTSAPRQLPGLQDTPPTYVSNLLAQDRLPDDALPRRVSALTIFRTASG